MSEIRYSSHRTLNEVMWCDVCTFYMVHVLLCSRPECNAHRAKYHFILCQNSSVSIEKCQWCEDILEWTAGHRHSCGPSSCLMEKKYSAPSGRLREDWGNQESRCYVKTQSRKAETGSRPLMGCLHTSLQTEWPGWDRERQLQKLCKYFARTGGAVNRDYNREREEGKVCLEKWSEAGMLTLERESRHLDVGMEREKWPLQAESRDGSFSCREGNRAETRWMRIIELNYLVLEQMRLSTRNKDGI